MRDPSPSRWLLHGAMFLLGLLLMLPAANILYSYYHYRVDGTAVVGTVSHPASSRGLGGSPLITYLDHTGNSHEFKTRAKTHWFKTPVKGETHRVYYLPEEPTRAIVDSHFHYLVLPLVLLGAGAWVCLRGLLGLLPCSRPLTHIPDHN